ncbi:dihydropteroate synthase [Roseburia sp. NSJ-9]|jgi:dihydropteroate synthase|uniref:Dihydropteroate synthase n=1 Tax=Roseburia lenta TaxID=2763061 RepID=A0ABR7GCB4_9FIRM|nr:MULTISPECIES: dihydropteroate synthase [Roseburia]MBC5685072.1 dihydropteroate synthase [Roseburia lenta]RHO32260.1 dihydropteroate synthase [Roseburia sp. AM16-25]
MIIGNQEFLEEGHTYVMGILNVTPDSFSDGGRYNHLDAALKHTEQMIKDGAAIIDVGGESTRPGHEKITDQEEIDRILPVIEKIKQEFSVPVSLDTYKAAVAKEGIQAGADLLNDIWGLQYDPAMGKIVADSGVAYCLMHNRDKITEEMDADLFIGQMKEDAKRALDAGIKKERIILDPGVGFAKTQEQNLMTIANLDRLKALGYPVLLGTSRKSVIGYVLDVPTDKRLVGTLATSAVAVQTGCMFVRVHDVKENVELIQMLERIRESR